MARKRYKKKRADYRKGGRVRFDAGGGWGDDWKTELASSSRYYATPTQVNRPMTSEETEEQSAEGGYDPGDSFRVGTGVPLSSDQTRKNVRTTFPFGAGSSMGAQTVGAAGAYTGGSTASSSNVAQGNPVANTAGYTGRAKTGGGTGVVKSQRGKGNKQSNQDKENKKVVLADNEEPTRVVDNSSRQAAQDIVAGTRQGPQIPAPQQVQAGPDAQTMQMGTVAPVTAGQITAPTLDTATQAEAVQAQAPDAVTAAQMQAAQVTPQEQVIAATGDIGDQASAQAAQVDRVAPIEAVDVEIPEGALTERIVGVMSPNAIATAAQAAGTTLSRVTRAKKQLRNAGISEQVITDLGNDPETLEDRLMDLTQEERGVIGDLPEEALVSNQLDSLLKGMESGEIPTWASPAVAAVEQMLAQRGLSASTVGRDNLFNAIIQSAVPIAQSNAQAIQQSVAQSREIESREEIFNAQARQQTALQNASNVFQMDMAQFSADQQTALSNSKFLQTVSLTEASNRQQTAIQNAAITAQMNLADADFYQKAQIQNAQAFLGMDMANLSNSQQATILSAQINQQSMLSNQSAINAARQFNATSENQTQQFMAGLSQQIELTNTAAANSISQFNAQQANAAAATEFQVEADLNKAKAAMETDIDKFNSQLAFNRNQWNAANAQAVEQSNIAWRRQANTINTAAANQVAMQNAMNAFNLNGQSLAFLWQELRDQAAFDFQAVQNEEDRTAQIYIQSLANQSSSAASMAENIRTVGAVLSTMWSGTSKTQYTASDKAGG